VTTEQADIFCYVITGMSLKDFSEQMTHELTEKTLTNKEPLIMTNEYIKEN